MPDSERGAPPALVLTAGLGTRLRPLTYVRAKAAVPVNGEPLARRVIRWLAVQGVCDLVLNLHHLPHTIAATLGEGADLGVRIRYSWEQPILGSAGGPRRALPLLTGAGGPFLIVNGDTLTDLDLGALLARHEAAGAAVTMAVIPNPRPDKYGSVIVAPDGWVTGFSGRRRAGEKPVHRADGFDAFHFIGVQVAHASVFQHLEDGMLAESVADLYPRLLRERPRSIAAHVCRASFQDIGTPSDYFETCLSLAASEGSHLVGRDRVAVDESARLERTVVWDDVTVGAGARLTRCIVADGARVPPGTTLEGCAIVPAGSLTPAPGERIERGLLTKPL
ncbi:MAG TPA: NDP-sugar synthase [Vicinamibacterales bacterium]|nr:NDP-sugar synthase [Vicinamibacterales bacterium]